MRNAAQAIAWDLYRRNRWGLTIVVAYLTGLIVVNATPATGGQMALTLTVPLTLAFFYFLMVFSFGLFGDVAARHSMFPSRFYTLPVTTAALTGWPMLYGVVTVTVLWVAAARLAPWPSGLEHITEAAWPALYFGVILAWTQVLLWAGYPFRGMRIVVAVAWQSLLSVTGVFGIHYDLSDRTMIAILTPLLPLAWLAAIAAVARARRGEISDWRWPATLAGRRTQAGLRHALSFASSTHAQVWFEWRQHGWSLPVWVGFILVVAFGLLFLIERPAFVMLILVFTLLAPPVMAAFVGAAVHRSEPRGRDGGTFRATRPLTSAALVGAKLKVAAYSTLITWAIVLLAARAALAAAGHWPIVAGWAEAVIDAVGADRALVLALLAQFALVTATWKALVQSLYAGLSGRTWLIRTHIGLSLAVLIAILPTYLWFRANPDVMVTHIHWARLLVAVLVMLKLAAASWVVVSLHRFRVVGDATLVSAAAGWLAAVLALYGVFAWFIATPALPRDFLLLLAVLALPLTRLAAAPLALARNRHR